MPGELTFFLKSQWFSALAAHPNHYGELQSRFLGSVPRCAKSGIRPAAVDLKATQAIFK